MDVKTAFREGGLGVRRIIAVSLSRTLERCCEISVKRCPAGAKESFIQMQLKDALAEPTKQSLLLPRQFAGQAPAMLRGRRR